ncbi:hypothetical protein BKA80DRAFT_30643 [Phyllosticta citrichinensis]
MDYKDMGVPICSNVRPKDKAGPPARTLPRLIVSQSRAIAAPKTMKQWPPRTHACRETIFLVYRYDEIQQPTTRVSAAFEAKWSVSKQASPNSLPPVLSWTRRRCRRVLGLCEHFELGLSSLPSSSPALSGVSRKTKMAPFQDATTPMDRLRPTTAPATSIPRSRSAAPKASSA